MKKKDLLKLLADVPDDGDIQLWNGFVGDCQDISPELIPAKLSKTSFEYMVKCCFNEDVVRNGRSPEHKYSEHELSELKESWDENHHFEFDQYSSDDDIAKGNIIKHVYIIQAQSKGVTTFDRIGQISY